MASSGAALPSDQKLCICKFPLYQRFAPNEFVMHPGPSMPKTKLVPIKSRLDIPFFMIGSFLRHSYPIAEG
jgi:hypothetical protein